MSIVRKLQLRIFRDGGYGRRKPTCPWYIFDLTSQRVARIRDLGEGELELSVKPEATGYCYFRTKRECREILRRVKP